MGGSRSTCGGQESAYRVFVRIILKWIFKKWMGGRGLDSCSSEQGLVAGFWLIGWLVGWLVGFASICKFTPETSLYLFFLKL